MKTGGARTWWLLGGAALFFVAIATFYLAAWLPSQRNAARSKAHVRELFEPFKNPPVPRYTSPPANAALDEGARHFEADVARYTEAVTSWAARANERFSVRADRGYYREPRLSWRLCLLGSVFGAASALCFGRLRRAPCPWCTVSGTPSRWVEEPDSTRVYRSSRLRSIGIAALRLALLAPVAVWFAPNWRLTLESLGRDLVLVFWATMLFCGLAALGYGICSALRPRILKIVPAERRIVFGRGWSLRPCDYADVQLRLERRDVPREASGRGVHMALVLSVPGFEMVLRESHDAESIRADAEELKDAAGLNYEVLEIPAPKVDGAARL
jgi:hypothetical protein